MLGKARDSDSLSSIDFKVADIATNRKLHFSCYFKKDVAEDVASITAYAYDKAESVIQTWQTVWHASPSWWSRFEATYVLPSASKSLHICIHNFRKEPVFVKDPSLVLGDIVQTIENIEPDEITLLDLNYHAPIDIKEGESQGIVTLPIPGLYKHQIPLTFEVSTNPESALKGYRIYPREDNYNWLCAVEIETKQPIVVSYKSIVLVSGNEGKTSHDNFTEVSQWLNSTACVQCSNSKITKKAMELSQGTESLEETAKIIMEFAASNKGLVSSNFEALDAISGLNHGGSCTNRANLAAALLRANGVPARTVAHIPVTNSWMDQHWLTEYWHPEYGWIPLETSMEIYNPDYNKIVVLAVSSASDEERSMDGLQIKACLPGAPYLSTFVLSSELTNGYGSRQNFCVLLGKSFGKQNTKETNPLSSKF